MTLTASAPSQIRPAASRVAPVAMPFMPLILGGALALTVVMGTDAFLGNILGGPSIMGHDDAAAQSVRSKLWIITYGLYILCLGLDWKVAVQVPRRFWPALIPPVYFASSAFWSHDVLPSLFSGVQLIFTTVFAMYAGWRLGARRTAQALAVAFAFIAVCDIIFVVLLPKYGVMNFYYPGAWQGVYFLKNNLAADTELGLVTFVMLGLSRTSRFRVIYLGLAALSVLLVLGSQSKGGLVLLLLLPFFLYSLNLFRLRGAKAWPTQVGVVVAATTAVTVGLFLYKFVLAALGKDTTLTGRTQLWSFAMGSVQSKPALGFGYDSYWTDTSTWGGAALNVSTTWDAHSLHNGWLEVLVQGGVIGMAIYAAFAVMLFIYGFKALRLSRDAMNGWPLMIIIFVFGWSLFRADLLKHRELFNTILGLALGAAAAEIDRRKMAEAAGAQRMAAARAAS